MRQCVKGICSNVSNAATGNRATGIELQMLGVYTTFCCPVLQESFPISVRSPYAQGSTLPKFSGFHQRLGRRCNRAPVGQTPIHRHGYRRDKVSVISGISGISVSLKRQRPHLYYYLHYDNIGRDEVCLFLPHLLRFLRGQAIVLLDYSRTHKGEPLESYSAAIPVSILNTFLPTPRS